MRKCGSYKIEAWLGCDFWPIWMNDFIRILVNYNHKGDFNTMTQHYVLLTIYTLNIFKRQRNIMSHDEWNLAIPTIKGFHQEKIDLYMDVNRNFIST